METKEFLIRIRDNFFSILIPGLYIFIVLIIFIWCIFEDIQNLKDPLNFFINFESELSKWPLILVLILASYLIGNILRVISVNTTDWLCKKLFYWSFFYKNKQTIVRYTTDFPYPSFLNSIQNHMENPEYFSEKKRDILKLRTNFNQWKIKICNKHANLFSYIRFYEENTRLYAGMFWAGFLGFIFSLLILLIIYMKGLHNQTWLLFIILCLSCSFIIAFLFGRNLRKIRTREVKHIYLVWKELK